MKKLTAKLLTAILLALGLLCAGSFVLPSDSPFVANVYADPVPDETETPSDPEDPEVGHPNGDQDGDQNENHDEDSEEEGSEEQETEGEATKDACQEQTGSLSWIVCPSSSVIAGATDMLYNAIKDMLEVNPIAMGNKSPIYLVWKYLRDLTNIIFIICLIIVIYSQITGLGVQNYGVKRILPRLIISVVLVNLSFLFCALAVDVSNVIGESLRGTFATISEQVLEHAELGEAVKNFSLSDFLVTVLSGGTIVGVTISAIGGGQYIFFMLLVILVGAVVAVISGLITIAARQALIALLIMISPLAFVAYLLPNTEKWFEKWKSLLFRMLVFYPLFSFLFGASQAIGYTLILAAKNGYGIILGVAVQIFPLFFGWSLMKMSGTVLEAINRGVRKVASPIQRGLTGWGLSHAEQSRQYHIANSTSPGAKLRRYLDYRQTLRELDTKNSTDTRHDRALEAAYKTASSSRGHNADGNLHWDPIANRYTQNAKMSSLYQTRASTAESAYKNTLTAYGRIFSNSSAASRLSEAHAEAYKDNMAQQFLTANEAQADQDYLLGQYLKAQNNQEKDPYEFNRLVKSAAGSLGHTGESSIMGQVIINNATTESRRRTEARVMITKFGIDKLAFRGMTLDTEHINDNGIETDENGYEIQDDQYRMKNGYTHRKWKHYIGRHKTTGAEITKEEYDRLDPIERSQYTKVKYVDIKDDNGNIVQRVFDDDAGYMKELLNDTIAIGDPINDRYLAEIGVAHANSEKTGILRKYHSTIANAINSSGYGEHNAADSMMVTSQANLGYITSAAQLSIAQLQSIGVAVKPGKFLLNDANFIKKWARIIRATYGLEGPNGEKPEDFSYFFPDDELYNYRNVNAHDLPGLRLENITDDDGNVIGKKWVEIPPEKLSEMTYDEVVQARKDCLKHKIIPKSISRMIGITNREFSPAVIDAQKPGTLTELKDLVQTLISVDEYNSNEDVAFENRPDGTMDTLVSKADRHALMSIYSDIDSGAGGARANRAGGNSGNSGANRASGTNRAGNRSSGAPGSAPRNVAGSKFVDKIYRNMSLQDDFDRRNDPAANEISIREIFMLHADVDEIKQLIFSLFNEAEKLQNYADRSQEIFDEHLADFKPESTEDGINNTVNYWQELESVLHEIEQDLIDLVHQAYATK